MDAASRKLVQRRGDQSLEQVQDSSRAEGLEPGLLPAWKAPGFGRADPPDALARLPRGRIMAGVVGARRPTGATPSAGARRG